MRIPKSIFAQLLIHFPNFFFYIDAKGISDPLSGSLWGIDGNRNLVACVVWEKGQFNYPGGKGSQGQNKEEQKRTKRNKLIILSEP